MQHAGVGEHFVNTHPVELFDAGADVEKARPVLGVIGVAIDRAVRQVVADRAQGGFAGAQCLARLHAVGNLFGYNEHAPDLALRMTPGADLPANPLRGAVSAPEDFAIVPQRFSGEGAKIIILPMLWQFWKNLVMRLADDICREMEVFEITAVGGEIAHVQVEHRHGDWRLIDDLPQLLFAFANELVGGVLLQSPPQQRGHADDQGATDEKNEDSDNIRLDVQGRHQAVSRQDAKDRRQESACRAAKNGGQRDGRQQGDIDQSAFEHAEAVIAKGYSNNDRADRRGKSPGEGPIAAIPDPREGAVHEMRSFRAIRHSRRNGEPFTHWRAPRRRSGRHGQVRTGCLRRSSP